MRRGMAATSLISWCPSFSSSWGWPFPFLSRSGISFSNHFPRHRWGGDLKTLFCFVCRGYQTDFSLRGGWWSGLSSCCFGASSCKVDRNLSLNGKAWIFGSYSDISCTDHSFEFYIIVLYTRVLLQSISCRLLVELAILLKIKIKKKEDLDVIWLYGHDLRFLYGFRQMPR